VKQQLIQTESNENLLFRSSKAPTQFSLLILRSLEQLPRPPNTPFFNLTEDSENSENKESISEKDSNNEEIFENASENSDNSDNQEVVDSSFLNIEEALRTGEALETLEEAFQADGVFEITEKNFEYVRRSSESQNLFRKFLTTVFRIS
jgi:hypothetical protein